MPKQTDSILPALRGTADSVVAGILDDADRRQDEMRLSAVERKALIEKRRKEQAKKEKARKKEQAKKPHRLHLVLPVELKQKLDGIARWHHVTVSQVVAFLLFEAIDRYEHGEISFERCKTASNSPRYEFNLIHPQDTERAVSSGVQNPKKGWGR